MSKRTKSEIESFFDLIESEETIDEYRQSKYDGRHNPWNRPFISFDSETYGNPFDPAEPNKVMLFGASTGDEIHGPDVSSQDMLELIEKVARANPTAIFIGFGFDYDANYFLREYNREVAERIAKGKGRTRNDYRIEWRKHKYFRITGKGARAGFSCTIYETHNFFNGSLVAAYEKHVGKDELLSFVSQGKDQRAVFDIDQLHTVVIPYWEAEQKMLVKLMDAMREMIKNAGLNAPREWYGPSAIIARKFKDEGIKDHLNRELPEEFVRICQRAYFGGHIEPYQCGYHNGPIYSTDRVSAYPTAMLDIWSWQDSTVRYVDGSELDRIGPMPDEYKYSVWDIRYSNAMKYDDPRVSMRARNLEPHPFPHRMESGSIFYPKAHHTSVWSPELAPYWDNTVDVRIIGGWVIDAGPTRPFSFYADMFEQRAQLKAIGDPAEYAIKIAINSGYGKTAQRIGAQYDEKNNRWTLPTFHQLDWAGYITSHCRGAIYSAINSIPPECVVSVETDGIYSTVPIPNLSIGKKLGQWEVEEYDGGVFIQSGIYWLRNGGQWVKGRTRGFEKSIGPKTHEQSEMQKMVASIMDYLKAWESNHGLTYKYTGHRFNGTGRIKFDNWLTWNDEQREIMVGGQKRQLAERHVDYRPSERLERLINAGCHYIKSSDHSWPHPLPWSDYGNYEYKRAIDEQMEEMLAIF